MNIAALSRAHGLTAGEIQPPPPALTPKQRARAAGLHGAALRHASGAEQRVAVAAQFEAILVRQLLGKTLTSMIGSENDAATTVYGDLLSDSVAQKLTSGSGLGLARLLEQQLAPRLPALPPPPPSAACPDHPRCP